METITQRIGSKDRVQTILKMAAELNTEINVRDAFKLPDEGPAIYVGFWGCYNDGDLYGSWVDLSIATTADQIEACIELIRAAAPEKHHDFNNLEEFMVQDSQGLPDTLRGENPDLNKIETYLETLQQMANDAELQAYQWYCNNFSELQDYQDFQDAFCGWHESGEDYAMELFEGCATREQTEAAQQWPLNCIDWEKAWRELSYDGHWISNWTPGHGYAVFRDI